MVLTGIEALSLAATIFQMIDFSSKIVSKGKALYKSSSGILKEHEVTETAAYRLQAMCRKLTFSLHSTEGASGPLNTDDAMLEEICGNCITLSRELLVYLGKLKVPTGRNRKWKSFRQALKSVWSKEGVDEMARRLGEARKDLDTFILLKVQ